MMNESRPRMTHELRCWPEFFNATRAGTKKFELRRNDRDYRVGDELLLKEWHPDTFTGSYTGCELLVRVDYIMKAEDATFVGMGYENVSPLAAGYVIMSISHVH